MKQFQVAITCLDTALKFETGRHRATNAMALIVGTIEIFA